MIHTRETLDRAHCGNQDHVLVLAATCHPESGFSVLYFPTDGVLHIKCKECDRVVAAIMVARVVESKN